MRTAATERFYRIVFGTDTRAGKVFDITLLWMIVISVVVVILESIPRLSREYRSLFFSLEIFFSVLFTVEYILRIVISPNPFRYIRSRLGIIDLLGILPFYMSMFAVGYHYLIVFRFLRMLRVFRILRLFRFVRESEQLFAALRASFHKIAVFISFVLTIVVLLGTLMYVVEGQENGFTSIPESIYWTIVTITTVGYGDITPQTGLGKWIASVIMLCGYAIIAVPTGIVTVEMTRRAGSIGKKTCADCGHNNDEQARFCNYCGTQFTETPQQ